MVCSLGLKRGGGHCRRIVLMSTRYACLQTEINGLRQTCVEQVQKVHELHCNEVPYVPINHVCVLEN